MSFDPDDVSFGDFAFVDDFPPKKRSTPYICSLSQVEDFEVEDAPSVKPSKRPGYKMALEWAHKNNLFVYGGFVFYLIFGAGLFYGIEHLAHPQTQTAQILNESNCLSRNRFGIALFYATSLATTVSYGTVYACTVMGQIMSVIYATIGIPFVLIVLQKLGRTLLNNFSQLHLKLLKNLRVFCPIGFAALKNFQITKTLNG